MRHQPLSIAILVLAALGTSALAGPALAAPIKARRYIAVVDAKDTCPIVQYFERQQLFITPKVQGRLAQFCVYSSPKPRFAPKAPEFIRVDIDGDIVLPQGNSTGSLASDHQVRRTLADAYLASLGAFGGGKVQTVYDNPSNTPRIAIVDTAASRNPADALGKHGLAMALIAETARCPLGEVGCSTRTRFYQAFPNATGATNSARLPALAVDNTGLGSLGTIAQAIEKATARTDDHSPIIVNLSLGWEPELAYAKDEQVPDLVAAHASLLAGTNTTVPAPMQAVHAALVHASCSGALTIVASGNNTAGACSEIGPMEPAAWSRIPAPSPKECAVFMGLKPGKADTRSPGSLVYAVGGIMPNEDLLPISRREGTPPRVVPAFMAVDAKASIDPWTGTSVAAAALSGLAASAWTYNPQWTSHQVIRWLDRTGKRSPKLDAQRTVRISGSKVHDSLCTKIPGCEPSGNNPVPNENTGAAILFELGPVTSGGPAAPFSGGSTVKSACGDLSTYSVYRSPPLPQPLGASVPWARPQPETPLCPVCPLKGGKLVLSLDPAKAASLPSGSGSKVRLQQLSLQFYVEGAGYVGLVLPDTAVSVDTPTEIDLTTYSVTVGAASLKLVDVLASPTIEAGTLRVRIRDELGNLVFTTSVIPVYH